MTTCIKCAGDCGPMYVWVGAPVCLTCHAKSEPTPRTQMTVREHFAALAMQGLLAAGEHSEDSKGQLAIGAIAIADALIERLNK